MIQQQPLLFTYHSIPFPHPQLPQEHIQLQKQSKNDLSLQEHSQKQKRQKSNNQNCIKGQWTQEEDNILLAWVKKCGQKNWVGCSNTIFGRTGKQCRERWYNNVNPDIKKGNWTAEEDNLIFDHYVNQKSSLTKIAKLLKGRSENSVKNRFYSAARKILQEKQGAEKDEDDFWKSHRLYNLLLEQKHTLKKTLAMQNYSKIYREAKMAKQLENRMRIQNQKQQVDTNNINERSLLELLVGVEDIKDLLKGLL